MERPALHSSPIWVVVVDYVLGIDHVDADRAHRDELLPAAKIPSFFFMRFFVRATDPLMKLFAPITPSFLLEPLVPLYVAWFFFMIRFYLMPWLLGYSVMGMLSFPLEGEIAQFLYQAF